MRHNKKRRGSIYAPLKHPLVYMAVEWLVGSTRSRNIFVREYMRPRAGDKVLDIGCGTGDILRHLPAVEYFGFDANPAYIKAAQEKFGERGHFECGLVDSHNFDKGGYFDYALCIGVLHHLTDTDAQTLFASAQAALKPGGRLLVIEPCYTQGQSRLARHIISRDRGENVRTVAGYSELAEITFTHIKSTVRHDMLWIPYTHLILECTKD